MAGKTTPKNTEAHVLDVPRITQPAYTWTPLKPMRATVIPVRGNGRIAPDVCDGVAVSMDSRVEYQRRAA